MGVVNSTLEDLAARAALQRLVTAYSRAVDRRDFPLLRSLYHDDGFEEHGRMFKGDADAYVEFVKKALSAYEATVHYVVNTNFEIAGDEAEGEVHKINYHRVGGADSHEIITGSRSLDRYRRRNGEWRFLSRSVTLDWAVQRPVNPEAYRDFAANSPLSLPGPDDLSYKVLTMFSRHAG
jgi:hypothetical protein